MLCQDNIEQFLLLRNVVWSLLDNIAQAFYLCNVATRRLGGHWAVIFPVECCLQPLGQHRTRILPVQCCPESIKTRLNSIFSVSSLLDHISQGFYLCNVVPRVLRQHWTVLCPVQYCLEPIGQYCTRILSLLCYPKSMETTLNSSFSSQISWTTLHKGFTCAKLCQWY